MGQGRERNSKMENRMMQEAQANGQGGHVMSQLELAKAERIAKYFEEDFTPCNDWIVIKVESKQVTAGGVVLPDGAKADEEPDRAVVIKAGPGLKDENGKLIPMKFKTGDVLYPVFNAMRPAMQFKVGHITYFVCGSESIVGVSLKHNGEDRVKELIFA